MTGDVICITDLPRGISGLSPQSLGPSSSLDLRLQTDLGRAPTCAWSRPVSALNCSPEKLLTLSAGCKETDLSCLPFIVEEQGEMV